MIICIVAGTFVGEFLKIEDRFNQFGLFIEKKLKWTTDVRKVLSFIGQL